MPTPNGDSNSSVSNKECLGKIAALLLTVAMMVGTGIFTTLGAATAKAQSGILVAMLIGVVIVLLTGLSAAQAGVNYPEEGGAFIWMRIFGYPTVSFIAGISYLVKGIVGLSIAALGFAHYSAQIFHDVPIPISASIAILAVAAVNYFGLSPTAKTIIGLFFINLTLLGLYVGFTAPHIKASNMSSLFGPGITGILSGAAIFFWSWDGFQRTAIMADKMKNPRRTIPFAIVGGILLAAVIYLIIAGVTLGVLGAGKMGKSDTPLFGAAKMAWAGRGIWVILASAWLLAFSDILGDLMSTSKVGHAMGQEHELPHWLGIVHKRLKSPQFMILLLTIAGLVLVNVLPLRRLLPVVSSCTLIWYIITNFAALKINKEKRLVWPLISWLGIVTCAALFFSLPLWSVVGALGFLTVLTLIRWLVIRVAQKAVVDTGGNWAVSGLALAEGDVISVTAQYACESKSTEATTIVVEAPRQTVAPVISGSVTTADTTVSGKAPPNANVIFSVNGVAQTSVVANGGNWTVSGLTLSQGDAIAVTAQSIGETMSTAATAAVAPTPFQAIVPVIIDGPVTEASKTVSGKAPAGACVTLCVNEKSQQSVEAPDGIWSVSNLTLSQGDTLSATAQFGSETVNAATTMTVAGKPLQTATPVISRVVTAADSTISGTAPSGASIVLSVNGVARPAVVATSGKIVGAAADTIVAPDPLQTAMPVISGIIKATDKTISGTAPINSSVALSVNGVAQPAVIAYGGNWLVSGLTLAQGDSISVTAQSAGETMSMAAMTSVQ